nr:dienelactone hydrolase family protein [Rhodoferax sp.]
MLGTAVHAGEPQAVQVPAGSLSTSPAPLRAFLFRPLGDEGVRPAVVMVHGCGGAFGKNGALNARHRMWGEYLAGQGYVALMLDSFSARGFRQICTIKFSERTLKEADRTGDAYAALAYLRQLPQVDPARIALLGWSHGGGVTLNAISHPPDKSTAAAGGFRAAVALYPGCTARSKRADKFHPYAPLLLLMGEADDWTPAAPCQSLASVVAARGEPMQIITYPETYHDFDNPALTARRLRTDVPNGVTPGAGVTIAPNPVAREDAKERVKAFFAEHLK